jgi:hypothetical protein
MVRTETGKLPIELAVLPPTKARLRLQKAFGEEDEWELHDILEPVNRRNVKGVVVENIEYVLRREKALSKDMQVYISEGGYSYDLYGDEQMHGYFRGMFGILGKRGGEIATGEVHGTISFDPPELVDLTVWITQVW